ncbi:MAG: type VI secretion system contractile sheath large subunit, partial [Acidobacteriia bacterium]|nr:type VI secretion system contractile sheath large subunit [Terriglobia bacterium]
DAALFQHRAQPRVHRRWNLRVRPLRCRLVVNGADGGVRLLVRRLETGEDLRVSIVDMPQAEAVSADGAAELRRIAVTEAARTPGAARWAAIAGLYYFGPEDETALEELAAIAREAGAPFLGGLAPQIVGLSRVFPNLRRCADAPWVGLALPRFLLRLPYGKETDSTEAFEFEEMPSAPEHQRYLWGHPALACACLLGEAFALRGWEMRPGMANEIDGLPLHVFRNEDGEADLKPCAEALLTEDAAELLLDRGFIPLVSIKGTARVRVIRFQSVADPPAPLAGRWT